MCKACFTPAVAELAGTDGETHSHFGVAECEDWASLSDTLGSDKLEVAIAVLSYCQVSDVSCRWVELGEVTAACLAVAVEICNHLSPTAPQA